MQTNKGDKQGFLAWLRLVVAIIIDLLLFERIRSFLRVYLVLLSRRYLLADSILLDNYKVVYIVNAKDLLLSDSIMPTDFILFDVRIR